MHKISFFTGLLLWVTTSLSGQVTTTEQIVQAALQHHPRVRAAALDATAGKFAARAAAAFSNPEINVESPTGEFYAVGILQAFDFPTAYSSRRKLARAETGLAEAAQHLTESELRFVVRTAILEVQVADLQQTVASRRDSLAQALLQAANRLFEAGEMDYIQKILTENEAGNARQALLAAQNKAAGSRIQLGILSGLDTLGTLEPLRAIPASNTAGVEHPETGYARQAAVVAARKVRVVQQEQLPNFSLGYLNQGPRQTPLDYRFRASVGIPIWFAQNRSAVNAAKAAANAAENRVEAAARDAALALAATENEAITALAQVQYFETEALPRSRKMVEAASRMQTAGQMDFSALLRTLDTAFSIENDYINQLKNFESTQIKKRYLTGN
jgi:outer membrane protein TolC